jgi:type IX secretion system PorP/SprF family membrane protein
MIKMKKVIVLIALAVLGMNEVLAQQVPLYSHYYYNQFLYNPSLAGSKDYGQLYMINRTQWNSIPGAPKTQALTLDGPLRNKKVGLGLAVYRDQAGQFNITGGQAAYRYSLDFGNDNMLSFGLGLGVLNNRLNLNDIRVQNELDPNIINSYQAATGFDANIGVSYRAKDFLVGLTIPQIIGNELAYQAIKNPITGSDVRYGMIRHYIVHASYDWDLQDDGTWFLQPNAMVRVTPNAPTQYDVSVVLNYSHNYWIGAMYRSKYAVTASAGIRLADQFVAGYAYDIATHTDLNQYTKGAHEVMLGYQFGGSQSDDPELKKRLKEINDKIDKGDKEVDSLGKEVKKNRDDIDENSDDINDNQDGLDEIRSKIKTFEDFMNDYKSGSGGNGGVGTSTGEVFTFNNVYFETNKWDINGVSTGELDGLVDVLKENSNLKIELAGHADERGSESYNIWLSNKRSNAVRDYLIRKGVSPSQLEVKGYGEGDPASSTSLDKNRRVEFKILSK